MDTDSRIAGASVRSFRNHVAQESTGVSILLDQMDVGMDHIGFSDIALLAVERDQRARLLERAEQNEGRPTYDAASRRLIPPTASESIY